MSYYQYDRCWASVEDIENSLVSASRITQNSEGAQRALVPPIPEPQDPFAMFNRKHNGQSIMGRGQMIMEQKKNCNVRYRDHLVAKDLSMIPGITGNCDFAIQQILSSAQFDDDSYGDLNEPSFESKKITSTQSTSGITEAVAFPSGTSPTTPCLRTGLNFTVSPQGAAGPSGINDADKSLDHPNVSESLPDVSAGQSDLSMDNPEKSSDQPETMYADPFYYRFDDSIYMKVDVPTITSLTEAPTPSPCSSPLPDHSTMDGHYVSCVQMESDSSCTPSPIFDPDPVHQNAADFSTRLRSTLPDDYKEVLSVWKDYQSGQITSSALELQISRLLGPYPDLMDAFFKFTSLSPSEEPESLKVESSNGEVPDEQISEVLDEPVTEVLQESINEVQNGPSKLVPEITRAKMFEDYIRFCRLAKDKFATQPDVFVRFLALLNDHKEGKIDTTSLIDEASHLFRFHLELVEGFKKLTAGEFCSVLIKAAGSIAADSPSKKVARLTESTKPRRCRNALILNLLKKEAASKDEPVTHSKSKPIDNEVTPIRLVSHGEPTENHFMKQSEEINNKVCDENGNSDVGESICVLNDLEIPSSTPLDYNSADVEIGIVSSTNCDYNIIDSRSGALCPVQDFDIRQVQTESLITPPPHVLIVDSATDDIANSLPLALQDKTLELLKPEDIIPDLNAEIPHSTLDMADEIVSSIVDSVVIHDAVIALDVVSGENDICCSEDCVRAEIELLKPSDFVHLELSNEEVCSTIALPDESVAPPADIVLEGAENLVIAEQDGEVGSSDSVEVLLYFGDESVNAISSSVDVVTPVGTMISADSASSSADGNQSSSDVATSSTDIPSDQDQCSVYYSSSDRQPSVALKVKCLDDTEQTLDTVVVALAKMDLNSDSDNVAKPDEPLAELELSSETEIFVEALPLPLSSDESSVGGSKEITADETAEITVTISADLPSSAPPEADQSPDQLPGSVPQVTPDCGPLLLRPDQFVTLSTAVDPHQVQQALQKHSADFISLD